MPDSPPPETLSWLRHAASCGKADAQLMLHILERLEALEARDKEDANCWASVRQSVHRLSIEAQCLREHIEALEQRPIPGIVELAAPAPEVAPVATDADLLAIRLSLSHGPIIDAGLVEFGRNCYNLGRQHGLAQPPAAQPAPPVAPAGGLVERVAEKMGPQSQAAMDAGELPYGAARAAIREVAAWIRLELNGRSVADRLELEADR
jgi:hypothetical protein